MHKCPTPNIRICEHFKTFPEESLLPDTLPPLNGTNPWLDYKAHHTEACIVLQLFPLFLLQSTCLWPKWGPHIPFLGGYHHDFGVFLKNKCNFYILSFTLVPNESSLQELSNGMLYSVHRPPPPPPIHGWSWSEVLIGDNTFT